MHRVARSTGPTNRRIERRSRDIASICQNPCCLAAVGLAHFEQRSQHCFTQAAPPMRRREPDFVNPQLGRLIGMDMVDGGSETDDQAVVNGDSDMMSRILQKYPGEFFVDWFVEHFCGDVSKHVLIAALQYFDFHGHGVVSLSRSSCV